MKQLWFYIYDEDILASRAHSPSVKSPGNAPADCSSIQFEIYSPGLLSKYRPHELVENTKYAIGKLGLANPEDVLFMDHRRIPYGNVIFRLDMEELRAVVRDHLEGRGIRMCGRFGEWEYFWSNQSFMSGYNVI